jgi:splicing factor 3B subunit 1
MDKAHEFSAGPLFDKILPLLMERTLEDQERHLLVKVIDRVLYKLDDLVRPYVHKILVVIEPLLIYEDYYARVEGREIISNLSKAAGLAHMISTMCPDIDHADEYVHNTTARAFSIVASDALGIPSLLPFLKAVCRSKKPGASHRYSNRSTDFHNDGLRRASSSAKPCRLYRPRTHRRTAESSDHDSSRSCGVG